MIPRNLFPQYKTADTAALVGFASNTRHLAPYNNPNVNLFCLNEAYNYEWMQEMHPAGWFQMHPKWDFMRANNRNDPHHWSWLQRVHDYPIFMQAEFPDVPSSVRYPIDTAIDAFGMYFTSSFSYMLALMILMGYRRIEIYGFEMSSDSEYVYQKPAAEYLMGFAKGLGVEIVLPKECSLLRGNLYAYEDLRAADRTFFSMREHMLKKEMNARVEEVHKMSGSVAELESLFKEATISRNKEVVEFLAGRYVERKGQQIDASIKAAAAEGAAIEMKNMIHWHDSQNIPADRVEEIAHE